MKKKTKFQKKLDHTREKMEADRRKKVSDQALLLSTLVNSLPPIQGPEDIEGIKKNAMALYSFGEGEVFHEEEVNGLLNACLNAGCDLVEQSIKVLEEDWGKTDLICPPNILVNVIVLLLGCQLYKLTGNPEEKKKHITECTNYAIPLLLMKGVISKQKIIETYAKLEEKKEGPNGAGETEGSPAV